MSVGGEDAPRDDFIGLNSSHYPGYFKLIVLAKSDAHNLWERFKVHEAAILLFAKEPHVAFTNNRAEQDLRMAKVKQKVSGCFRAEEYAHAYCRISSYLQTMANRGYNPLIAIQMALAGSEPVIGRK